MQNDTRTRIAKISPWNPFPVIQSQHLANQQSNVQRDQLVQNDPISVEKPVVEPISHFYFVDEKKLIEATNGYLKVQQLRRKKLDTFCKSDTYMQMRKESRFRPETKTLSITLFDKYKTFECHIPKTGSSTRGAVFWPVFHGGSTDWTKLHPMDDRSVKKSTRPDFRNKTRHYPFGFMFVRDPFDRALSGFFDRVLRAKPPTGLISFNQYFQMLVSSPNLDHHFKPQLEICDPCALNISFLGRLETMTLDLDYLINNATNFHNLISYSNQTSAKKSTYNLQIGTAKYNSSHFRGFDTNLLNKFIERYKYDYMAFGYSPNHVFEKFNQLKTQT